MSTTSHFLHQELPHADDELITMKEVATGHGSVAGLREFGRPAAAASAGPFVPVGPSVGRRRHHPHRRPAVPHHLHDRRRATTPGNSASASTPEAGS